MLADEHFDAGQHVIVWDGKNSYGRDVTSGIYFYLLEASRFADAKKMLVLR